MITLNNKNYTTLNDTTKADGYYKNNKTALLIFDNNKKLKYAIRKNDGMVCRASKLDNGKIWYQYHLSNEDFKGYITTEELKKIS